MRVTTAAGVPWALLMFAPWGPALPAGACTLPVYQYALEAWTPDNYEIIVFHQGAMPPPPRTVVESIEQAISDEFARPNATLRLVDLSAATDDTIRSLWETQPTATLPWLVVRQPARWTQDAIAWSGPLDQQSVQLVMDSPARREIARRIGQGDAAVWLFLDSGQSAADEQTFRFLEAQLNNCSTALARTLPEDVPAARTTTGMPPEPTATRPPRFSVVRVSRSDPAEQPLVQMLLNSEDDLKTFREPMAFPVFGRGRVLYALVGRGITERNIAEACAYVSDACSCWVKDQNPGCDLLIRADWETIAHGQFEDTPEWPGAPVAELASGAAKDPTPEQGGHPSCRLLCNSILGLAGGVVIVALAAWILLLRDRSREA